MRHQLTAIAALAAAAILVSGCVHYSHGIHETVHDPALTYDDYDGVTSFTAPPGTTTYLAPLDVHEFDPAAVSAGGGTKVIGGDDWLAASDEKRGTLLQQAQAGLPEGVMLVLVIATGDVWALGPNSGDLFSGGTIKPWTGEEYDRLSEFYVRAGEMQITRDDFDSLTAVVPVREIGQIRVIHDLGPVGVNEIQSAHGLEIISPQHWVGATPIQRAMELTTWNRYLQYQPAFRGSGNQPSFGVSVSWGAVYAVPGASYDNLIGWGSIKPWTAEQIGTLPSVLPSPDRMVRNQAPFTVQLDTKF
jgi:hypothetical protein